MARLSAFRTFTQWSRWASCHENAYVEERKQLPNLATNPQWHIYFEQTSTLAERLADDATLLREKANRLKFDADLDHLLIASGFTKPLFI